MLLTADIVIFGITFGILIAIAIYDGLAVQYNIWPNTKTRFNDKQNKTIDARLFLLNQDPVGTVTKDGIVDDNVKKIFTDPNSLNTYFTTPANFTNTRPDNLKL